jgi:hypothetical protein
MDQFRVAPPFEARSHIVVFVSSLLLALLFPLVNHAVFRPTAADVLRAVPPHYRNYHFMGDAIAKGGDVDILIVGSSDAWTAFDVGILTEEISKIAARPVRILNFGADWFGTEANFVRIQYALSNLKAKVAVVMDTLGTPAYPHVLAKYWWLHPDEDVPASLTFQERATLYTASVLGAPRQSWANLRRASHLSIAPPWQDYASGLERTSGFYGVEQGWHNAPYVERTPPWRDIPTDPMFYRNGKGDAFRVGSEEYTEYETAFLKEAAAIVRAQGGTFAMASNLVLLEGRQGDKALFRPLWRNEQRPWPQIGIPTATLFAGLSDEETHAFYFDDYHVNASGAKHYSRAIAPALAKLLIANENR